MIYSMQEVSSHHLS